MFVILGGVTGRELSHVEGQRDLAHVGAQNLNFCAIFLYFLGLLHKLFIKFFLVVFNLIDIVMVENVVDDGVDLKPTSGSKLTLMSKFPIKLPLKLTLMSKFPIKLPFKQNLPVVPSFTILK